MALLQLVSEEQIPEDSVEDYFEDLYRIVCVSERPASLDQPGGTVRTTYLVDWEQLVHLLEDYTCFGEDIVEVSAIGGDEARLLRTAVPGPTLVARA
jgi:hypothetical protein